MRAGGFSARFRVVYDNVVSKTILEAVLSGERRPPSTIQELRRELHDLKNDVGFRGGRAVMARTRAISELWGQVATSLSRCRHAWVRFWLPYLW
jgi:hypothetical protein